MAEQAKNTKKRSGVRSFIGGTILTDERITRQLPFLLVLAGFGLLLIANRNWSEKTIREIEVIQDTLDELRSESITLSAKLMDASRPSEVAKKVEEAEIGLQEPVSPPQKLVVEKE
ncbi:MAG: FtsL-like putative cell division protein [Draconibacterium sp.]|nr:FtsL-like putative cell division protein [Draconibacterium sp.]